MMGQFSLDTTISTLAREIAYLIAPNASDRLLNRLTDKIASTLECDATVIEAMQMEQQAKRLRRGLR